MDLTNSRTIIILVIVCILLFTCVYVWNIKNRDIHEGFAQYNINNDDVVGISDMKSIIIGDNADTLTTVINNMIQDKLKTIETKYVSADTLSTQFDQLTSTVNGKIDNIQQTVSDNNKNINDVKQLVNTNNDTMNTNINNAAPPLSVVAYYGSTIPNKWQLCDGQTLKYDDNNTPVKFNNVEFKTPNLLGRTIIGSKNDASDTNLGIVDPDNKLGKYLSGNFGGEQYHKLTVAEMPAHDHVQSHVGWNDCPGRNCPRYNFSVNGYTNDVARTYNEGGDKPHNNMQPWFALKYIIKQPPVGTTNLTKPEGYIGNSGSSII